MFSLPNILTMSRIFAVPILVFLLWPGTKPFGVQPVPLDYAFAFIIKDDNSLDIANHTFQHFY
jgi:CDP-diacylglycerol--glycerol-3-phosphate 3-phosphatidyltransferase/cardiolipin synthase